MRSRPRLRACVFTHSAVAARCRQFLRLAAGHALARIGQRLQVAGLGLEPVLIYHFALPASASAVVWFVVFSVCARRQARPHGVHTSMARWLQVLLLTLWPLLISNAYAATQTYQLYIDTDQQAATGCQVTLTDRAGSVRSQGHKYRLTVGVDDAGAASAPLLAACRADSFGADAAVGSVAPISTFVSTGTALTDQLELAVPLAAIGNPPRFGVLLASQGDYLGQGTGSAVGSIALTQSALISGADIARA